MIHARHIDTGWYRISDKAAGILSKRSGFQKLPKRGMEQRIIVDDFPFWLARTPHCYLTDSPNRGWVWSVRYAGRESDADGYPGIEKLPSFKVSRYPTLMDDL
jgi:hypothetical protein